MFDCDRAETDWHTGALVRMGKTMRHIFFRQLPNCNFRIVSCYFRVENNRWTRNFYIAYLNYCVIFIFLIITLYEQPALPKRKKRLN